ncbi:MAG: Helicase associated domain protein [Legionellales bacterium]|nr:Helicase associated domain protein [Legionellales bacterium]
MGDNLNKNTVWQHQKEAVKSIVKIAKTKKRAQVVMACGSGKTLVGLQYAIKSNAKNILVLLPSLGLMKQTYEYWLANASWGIDDFMCVCSDKSVAGNVDAVEINKEDFNCYVSTDVADIKEFFKKRNSRKRNIIFCTYQSAEVLSRAMPKNFSFDLGIFDEAHKTAGRKNKHFALALDDKNIKIGFRLFMTATPKHYRVSEKDGFAKRDLAYSMDDKDVYGDVCYEFSFADAIEKNVICDYKIIISVIDSGEVDRSELRASKSDVGIEAEEVAHRLALSYALKKQPVNKIISFHSTIKDAKEFASRRHSKCFKNIENFNLFHVSGNLSSDDRHNIIEDFRASEKSLLSNARCLTEGIDVPAVDCVAFLHPKRSSIDIVQAVGRAMRKAKDKKCGYIFIPLYINNHKDEDFEKAAHIMGFDCVVNVLNALKETDGLLGKLLTGALANSVGFGKYDLGKLKKKIIVEYKNELKTEFLERTILTKIVSNMVSSWEYMYEELKKYKEKNGDCDVPKRYPENKRLGEWVVKQRGAYKKGVLLQDKIDMLNEIGFEWNPVEAKWMKSYGKLCFYFEKMGDSDVPANYSDNKLARWVEVQRKSYKLKKLSINKIKKLETLYFTWNFADLQWSKKFEKLKEYFRKNRQCNYFSGAEEKALSGWVARQRILYKQNKLNLEQINKLEEIGFVWVLRDKGDWPKRYKELAQYRKDNGDCNFSRVYPKNKELGVWVCEQRRLYKKGTLAQDKVDMLEKIGFVWDFAEAAWMTRYKELIQYRKENEDCDVPYRYSKNKELGTWVRWQRTNYKNGKISKRKIRLLEKLGFKWVVKPVKNNSTIKDRGFTVPVIPMKNIINDRKYAGNSQFYGDSNNV